MKRLLSPLLVGIALLSSALPTFAAPVGGQLIKASGQAVYYMGMDGKRYVFPNEATYRSWYSDFSGVQTITDTELSQIMIGGNVTYRPGTRLVKITTDPKVYAVSGNGSLRWVTTEALAVSLFGNTWAQQVDDLPDPFFINYRVGASIQASADYTREQEQSLSTNIAMDRARGAVMMPTTPITPPAPTSTTPTAPVTPTSTTPVTPTTPTTPTSTSSAYRGTLTVSGSSIVTSGSGYTVIARPSPSGGILSIRLQTPSSSWVTCESDYCQPRFVAPAVTATTTQTITGVFNWVGPQTATTTVDVTIVPTRSSDQITVTASTTTVRNGNTREVTVRIGSTFSPRLINLFMDGVLLKQCENDTLCVSTEIEAAVAGTQHIFTATAENLAGERINSVPFTMNVTARTES